MDEIKGAFGKLRETAKFQEYVKAKKEKGEWLYHFLTAFAAHQIHSIFLIYKIAQFSQFNQFSNGSIVMQIMITFMKFTHILDFSPKIKALMEKTIKDYPEVLFLEPLLSPKYASLPCNTL